MERQFSAGGVVIKKEMSRPRILLIKDSYGRWTWPKGHIERPETPEEAALREVSEETGLKKIQVEKKIGKQQYFFVLKGRRIFKTVYIFLIKANAREKLAIQTSEIKEGRWFWTKDALERIEYKGSKELLRKGIEAFCEKYKCDIF